MWFVPVGVVCNPVYIPVCAPCGDLFQSSERSQDSSVAVMCDISLWHDNTKGNENTFGCVFSVALLP